MNDPVEQFPVRQLALAVFRANGRLVEAGNDLVRPVGLTSAWWQVLGALGYATAPLPVAHIARNMGLTRQAVQRVADVLAAQGLVRFEANPRHRRAMLVVMTDAGRAALNGAEAAVLPLDQQILERVGLERIATAVAVLLEMNDVLENYSNEKLGGVTSSLKDLSNDRSS